MVQKRILDPDCLRLGWVLVDYPNTAEDVDNLFSLLVVPQKYDWYTVIQSYVFKQLFFPELFFCTLMRDYVGREKLNRRNLKGMNRKINSSKKRF